MGDGLPPPQKWEVDSFSFLSSAGERGGIAVLGGFVTGVEEKVGGLVRLCLFHVLTVKEMLK